MAVATCGDQPLPEAWCPATVDDVVPTVLGLLPPGPAWDAAQQPGTIIYAYWRAIGDVLFWLYGILCAFYLEFWCFSKTQSTDQWNEEYGTGEPCDPFGYDQCTKVTAVGGQTCAFFVQIALANHLVIDCTKPPLNGVVGCMQPGAFQCGPPAILKTNFPAVSFPARMLDRTGNFTSWGNFYVYLVAVHVAQSFALWNTDAPRNTQNVGQLIAGCFTSCGPSIDACTLEKIAPAEAYLSISYAP